MTGRPVRILSGGERHLQGGLFERLCRAYLMTLGYSRGDQASFPGRQVDIVAAHVTERRVAVAESKGWGKPVAGDVLNKFAGIVDLERGRRHGESVEAYFFALEGFTSGARQQERERRDKAAILVDGSDLRRQLIEGNAVVSPDAAVDIASRIVSMHEGPGLPAKRLRETDLVVWERGMAWAMYYGQTSTAECVVYVHADGAPIGPDLAQELASLDEPLIGGYLTDPSHRANEDLIGAATEAYREYLKLEFGFIGTDGIVTDIHTGSRKIPLEQTFVTQALSSEAVEEYPASRGSGVHREYQARRSIGSALLAHRQLAVLAVPGGGKTTLIKHLATTYGLPDRRTDVHDELPDLPLTPLVIRCRDLQADAVEPLRENLCKIPARAGFGELAAGFESLLGEALHAGRALILIDGLDEISDERTRKRFANQLVRFFALYPSVFAVITARPAGFRLVASDLTQSVVEQHLCELAPEGVKLLCRGWMAAVEGESQQTSAAAEELAQRIISDVRLRRIAGNPLLLTTLLIVKRGIGELPRKRSVLYEKALEVLLATWNVEGHQPIDPEDVIPQLAWIAFEMCESGRQRIGGDALFRYVRAARQKMGELFGGESLSVGGFAKRIEERSSILHMVGLEEKDGRVERVYEFKHLSFQEYLAAIAIVREFCGPRIAGEDPIEMLCKRLNDPSWSEIVALAAINMGRHAAPLIGAMVEKVVGNEGGAVVVGVTTSVLAQCLVDGVKITTGLAHEACVALALSGSWRRQRDLVEICEGPYGALLWECVEELFVNDRSVGHTGRILGELMCTCERSIGREVFPVSGDGELCRELLRDHWLASHGNEEAIKGRVRGRAVECLTLLEDERLYRRLAGMRGLAVEAMRGGLSEHDIMECYESLVVAWRRSNEVALSVAAAEALAVMPLTVGPRRHQMFGLVDERELRSIVREAPASNRGLIEKGAAVNVLHRLDVASGRRTDYRVMMGQWMSADFPLEEGGEMVTPGRFWMRALEIQIKRYFYAVV